MRIVFAIAIGLVVFGACSPPNATPPDTAPRSPVSTTAPRATTMATPPSTTLAALSAPSSTTTTTTTTTLAPLVLTFAGDTSFTHGSETRDPLADVTDWLSEPDLMFVNLETVVAEPSVGVESNNKYTFKSPPKSIDLLKAAGIDAVQIGNNHILDWGPDGVARTIELLDDGGIANAGAGVDTDAAYDPTFIDIKGWRIGFVSFSRIPCHFAASGVNTRPQVAWACDPFIRDTIEAVKEASKDSDFVVVMVHWGLERNNCPEPYQRELARAWAQLGADIIVGGHPHVLQGVEQVEGKWLINSTGNFAFPSARGPSSYSAMYEFTITQSDVTLRVKPVRIVAGRPKPASPADTERILADLDRWSFGYDFDSNGLAVPSDAPSACGDPVP
jgi:poly-gamma-glutamate capsule biosynthesis protein CapA/YwtB (metallophosphatase superfamily)